ncbi:MAG: DUF2203 domain-containing protein [Anaerolineales bacterium]
MVLNPRYPKLFTAEEANQLLPKLMPIVEDMLAGRGEILRLRPDLESTLDKAVRNGGSPESGPLLEAFDRVKAAIKDIQKHGVLVKDVNSGLLDFPAVREGEVVFLCWRMGEQKIAYWHSIDGGFAGRQPL